MPCASALPYPRAGLGDAGQPGMVAGPARGVNCRIVSIRTPYPAPFASGTHSSTVACKSPARTGILMPSASTAPSLVQRLGVSTPIIQAPMAGVSTPALAAAVSNARGLGSLGLGASDAAAARQAIVQTRALTDRPFGVNLFCHAPDPADPALQARWLEYLAPSFAEFGAQPPATLREIYTSFVAD